MATSFRAFRVPPLSTILTNRAPRQPQRFSQLSCPTSILPRAPKPAPRFLLLPCRVRTRAFHTSRFYRRSEDDKPAAHQDEPNSTIGNLDVLGDILPPATAVETCLSDGFRLNNGTTVVGGDGVLLYAGEAFRWRPWVAHDSGALKVINDKGQWSVPNEAFQVFEGLWPRPDLLMIGTGPQLRPLAPELRKYIAGLGIRVEVVDTRNAAAQYNMLATERGEQDVAAALVPVGWKEGIGAR